MRSRSNLVLHAAVIAALALSIAGPAVAQGAPDAAGSRTAGPWEAWLGCWTPAGSLVRVIGRSQASLVCVVPTSTASTVEIVTVSGGKIVDRMRVDADGQQRPVTKDGCMGWQNAKFSPSGQRVYLKSEFDCGGASATHLSGLYAMSGSGEWIDVQGMTVAKKSSVHAVRYREAVDEGTIPPEIAQKLPQHSFARSAAMLAVTEQPTIPDIAEASRAVDASVVSTWLIEADKASTQEPAPLDAKQIVQLADAGVPGSVIDIMVGLSYPNAFQVNAGGDAMARQNADSVYARYGTMGSYSSLNPIIGFDRFGLPIYSSDASMSYGCSPFMYGPYTTGWDPYSCGAYGYGYSGMYGYGYGGYLGYGYGGYYGGYPYGGGYFGGGPVVVPVTGGSGGSGGGAPSHGRVVNGRGYSAGGDGSSGSAAPSSNGASRAGSGSGGASSSAPPQRTAVSKKP